MKRIYVKPEIMVYEMDVESLMITNSKGDGHEHDQLHIGGDDDSEWFSLENGEKVVFDDDNE